MKVKSKFSSVLPLTVLLLSGSVIFSSCSSDDDDVAPPPPENEVEEFTDIEFIFTNVDDPSDVRKGIWQDEDGFGPGEPVIIQHPVLDSNTTYRLTFTMLNKLMDPVENVLEEVQDEDDEHQIFFAFDENLFASPEGTGNIEDRNGSINYEDFDDNGLPVGLETLWTTGDKIEGAKFRAVLGHQPGVKSSTSSWNSGDIDWDITFSINVE